MDPLVVSPQVVIPEIDLTWTAVRSSGPGGQNVNKVSTKVELRFALETTSALSDAVKERVRAIAGLRRDAQGSVIVTCDVTRSQNQNLEVARAKLAELIRSALVPPKRRRPTRPTRGSVLRRLSEKSQTSRKKADRRGGQD